MRASKLSVLLIAAAFSLLNADEPATSSTSSGTSSSDTSASTKETINWNFPITINSNHPSQKTEQIPMIQGGFSTPSIACTTYYHILPAGKVCCWGNYCDDGLCKVKGNTLVDGEYYPAYQNVIKAVMSDSKDRLQETLDWMDKTLRLRAGIYTELTKQESLLNAMLILKARMLDEAMERNTLRGQALAMQMNSLEARLKALEMANQELGTEFAMEFNDYATKHGLNLNAGGATIYVRGTGGGSGSSGGGSYGGGSSYSGGSSSAGSFAHKGYNQELYDELKEACSGSTEAMLNSIPQGSPSVNSDRITSHFTGQNPRTDVGTVCNQKKQCWQRGSKPHTGTDFQIRSNSDPSAAYNLQATADGQIVFAGCGASGCEKGWGYLVVIKHASGFYSLYAHMDGNSVSQITVPSNIKKGDIIGLGDTSGQGTGPHVHYEVRYGSDNWQHATRYDPEDFALWGGTDIADLAATVSGNGLNPNKSIDFSNLCQ